MLPQDIIILHYVLNVQNLVFGETDQQTIYVYLNKLDEMPELTWEGVPQLFI